MAAFGMTGRGPALHRSLVEHVNSPLFGAYEAFALQILDDAADHFARRADHARNFLLGRSLFNYPFAIDVLRHVDEQARNPAVNVDQGQALDLAVRIPEPSHEVADDQHGQLEVVLEYAGEAGLGQAQHFARLQRLHAGRAGQLVEQAHFSEEFVGSYHRKDHLVTLFVRDQNLHPAGQYDVERVGFLARPQDERVARIAAMLDATQ